MFMTRFSALRRTGAVLAALTLLPPATALAEKPVAADRATDAHPRLLPLQGGQNFRDLGGYRTADGKTVRWNMLFRSGAMADLTAADFAYLGRLGLRTVVDFRSNDERAKQPVHWPASSAPTVLTNDYAMDMTPVLKAFMAPDIDGEKARAAMAHFYRDTPFVFADQYKRMFRSLLDGGAPLAFNCSAGKDRTGVAAALLLTALGVPRETVIEDYLLSNRYYKPSAGGEDSAQTAFFRTLPPEAVKALVSVDRSFIEASFAAIEERPGGLDGYFAQELGLTPVDLAALRARYLQ